MGLVPARYAPQKSRTLWRVSTRSQYGAHPALVGGQQLALRGPMTSPSHCAPGER